MSALLLYHAAAQLLETTPTDLVQGALRAGLAADAGNTLRALSLVERYRSTLQDLLAAEPELLAARTELSSRNYELALVRLRNYLERRPSVPFRADAYYLRGIAQFEQSEYHAAARSFDTASALATEEAHHTGESRFKQLRLSALFWKAVSYVHNGRLDSATRAFTQLLDPPNAYSDDAYMGLGLIAEQSGNYAEALACYDSAVARAPHGNVALAARIRAVQQLLLLRQPRAALQRITAAEEALARSDSADLLPPHPPALLEFFTAEAYSQLGQFEQAAALYRRLSTDPTLVHSNLRWQSLLGLGWVELNRGNYAAAQAAYTTVIDSVTDVLSMQRAQALLFCAVAVKRSGDVLKAIQLLDELIEEESFPLRAQALLERGQIEYERAQYHTAAALFERAARTASDPATMLRALLLKGRAELDQQHWQAAITQFDDLLQYAARTTPLMVPALDRITADATLWRGVAYANSDRCHEAVAELGQFIERWSNHPRRDEALLWLAECYEHLNMVANAADALEQLLNRYPNSPRREEALYSLGWAQFRLRRFDDALRTFERLLAEFPRTRFAVDVTLRKADILYLSRRYSDAARLYRQVAREHPSSEEGEYALYQAGQSLYRLGSYDQAIEQFRQLAQRFPSSPIADDALYNIAWIHMLAGRWNDAIAMFQTLERAYPQSELVPQARFYTAQCTYNSGQYVRAIELYRQFLAEHPSSPLAAQAIEAIQDAYINLGQDSLAVAVAREYIERNPRSEQSAQVALRTIDIFVRNRDFSMAMREYERFLEQYPDSRYAPEALYGLFKSLIALDNRQQAEQVLERLLRQYPHSSHAELALLDMALYLQQQAYTQRADSLFAFIMDRYPHTQSFARAAYERARIALQRGDTATALSLWYAATAGTGEYAYQARYRLGMWYRDRNEYDSARAHFRPIIAYTDNPPLAAEAAYRIGELWQRQGNCAAAADTFSLVLNRFEGVEDWYTLSMLGLAECAETMGDIDKARQLYQTIFILRPDDDFGRTAAARRRRLEKQR